MKYNANSIQIWIIELYNNLGWKRPQEVICSNPSFVAGQLESNSIEQTLNKEIVPESVFLNSTIAKESRVLHGLSKSRAKVSVICLAMFSQTSGFPSYVEMNLIWVLLLKSLVVLR